MRRLLPLILILSLAACQTAREVAGAYQRAAEKGIVLGAGDAPDPAAPGAATDARSKSLPGGLAGDTANRRYTTDGPVPK